MKILKKTNSSGKMGYTPIKAQNPATKGEPRSTVTKGSSDMRSKAGK